MSRLSTMRYFTSIIIFAVMGLWLGFIDDAQASYSACIKSPTQTCIFQDPITGNCDEYSNSYTCYQAGGYTNSCANTDMSGYYQVGPSQVNLKYPNGNTAFPPISYDTFYSSDASCSPVPSGSCGSMYNVQPEGNISGYTFNKACYSGASTTSTSSGTCNPNPKACTNLLSTICTSQQNGVCTQRELTYSCGSDTPSCNNVATGPSSNTTAQDTGLQQYAAEMGLAQQIAKNASFVNGQLRVFGGTDNECHFITQPALAYITTVSTATSIILTIFTAGYYAAAASVVSAYGVSVLGTMHCCNANPSSINPANGLCTIGDIRLANARKKNLAFRVDTSGTHEDDGDGNRYDCLNDAGGLYPPSAINNSSALTDCALADLVFRTTVINTQSWCYFPNMLSKIIQVQGRQQLQQLAVNNAAGAVQQTISFSYYGGPAGQGAWTSPININGNMVAAWQWPTDCSNPNTSSSSTLAGLCPSPHTDWIAICSNNNGTCATSPGGSPTNSAPNTGWSFVNVDTSQTTPTTLNRFAVTEGICSGPNYDGSCAYTIHAWPAGVGGTLHVNLNMNWPETYPGGNGWNQAFTFNSPVGTNLVFEAYTWNTGTSASNTYPEIRYSTDGGANWSAGINLPNPQSDMNFSLPGGPSSPAVTVYGGCTDGQCKYTLSYGVNVTTKPWGYYTWQKHQNCLLTLPNPPLVNDSYWVDKTCDSRTGCTTTNTASGICVAPIDRSYNYIWHADCSGFTMPQLESLDFSKMDFSAYLATLQPVNPAAATSSTQAFTSTANANASAMQQGAPTATAGNALNTNNATFTIDPSGAVWPGTPVSLVAKTSYPVTSGGQTSVVPVTGITVNWGDGTTSSMSISTSPAPAPTVSLTHTYGSDGCTSATSGSCAPSPSVPTTYNVSVTFQTAAGSFTDSGDVLVSTQGTAPQGSLGQYGAQSHGTVMPN